MVVLVRVLVWTPARSPMWSWLLRPAWGRMLVWAPMRILGLVLARMRALGRVPVPARVSVPVRVRVGVLMRFFVPDLAPGRGLESLPMLVRVLGSVPMLVRVRVRVWVWGRILAPIPWSKGRRVRVLMGARLIRQRAFLNDRSLMAPWLSEGRTSGSVRWFGEAG